MDFDDADDGGPPTVTGPGGADPTELGGCRLEARIASSAASRLYRAVDLTLGRTVVVKILTMPATDSAAAQRFLKASETLCGVVAPNLVQVLRTGVEGLRPYVVFEFVEGEDLDRALCREGALVPAVAARVILDAAQGLHAALAKGLTHGDVRPGHLLRLRGETKVTGFGLSLVLTTAQGRKLPGHPAYVSPEVAQGSSADLRSDMYSLGATLYQLITGRAPFGTTGPDALIACAVHEPFPSLAASKVRAPKELEDFLAKLTDKRPQQRFQSYGELLQQGNAMLPTLRRLLDNDPALVIEDGRQIGLRALIPEGDFLLGRVHGEGMNIDDARCSRRHAMIRRSGDSLSIEDLDSRNGIRVNGNPVKAQPLVPGDRIAIGDTTLRVEGAALTSDKMHAARASPVRGAFGDVEVGRSPVKQASADSLQNKAGPGGEQRQRLLASLTPLLAPRVGTQLDLAVRALSPIRDILGADHGVVVPVEANRPLFQAKSSAEAQVLSCTLPAMERALPGRLSLSTAVKVGRDDRWAVVLAPIFCDEEVSALLVLVKSQGHFDDYTLAHLEACCALLSRPAT